MKSKTERTNKIEASLHSPWLQPKAEREKDREARAFFPVNDASEKRRRLLINHWLTKREMGDREGRKKKKDTKDTRVDSFIHETQSDAVSDGRRETLVSLIPYSVTSHVLGWSTMIHQLKSLSYFPLYLVLFSPRMYSWRKNPHSSRKKNPDQTQREPVKDESSDQVTLTWDTSNVQIPGKKWPTQG